MFFRKIFLFFYTNFFIVNAFPKKAFKNFSPKIFYDKKQLNYGSNYRRIFKHQMGYTGLVQDHHCIPKEHRNHELLKTLDYNINNYDNIMIMPNKKGIIELKLHPNTLVHDGGHLQYNIYVKKQLNYIYKNYNDRESYKYQFWLLQKHLKRNMHYNQDNIPWR
tara:strand:+ start:411 stop:899 length:489 start_codon:yes stop_codon:yes gene_type:complete